MKDKVQSGEIPAAQAKKMQEKMSQSGENQQITPQKQVLKHLSMMVQEHKFHKCLLKF